MDAFSNFNVHSRGFSIAYWVTTILIASEMALGGVWDLLPIPYVRTVMEHLGYPSYFLLIIGAWKIPCAVALVAPRFPRLKEWAYAGAIFNYTGAVASHLAVGDGASKWVGPLVFAAVTLASWASRPPNRYLSSKVNSEVAIRHDDESLRGGTRNPKMEKDTNPAKHWGRANRIWLIAYWIFTLPVVFENTAGFVWFVLKIDYLRVSLAHLGYPQYFVNILGPWQFACAAALIAPRFPLVKEWAYAGAFFNYSSAIFSHMFVHDGPDKWVAPVVFAVFTVASWALRPADRRLARSGLGGEMRALSWFAPLIVLALLAVLALFTLPNAPAP